MSCEKREWTRLLRDAFLGELPATQWERLRAHLAVCPSCRADYDLQGELKRAMSPSLGPLPEDVLERLGEAAVARAAPPAPRRVPGWIKGVALALPAAAAAALFALRQPAPAPGEFQARAGPKAAVEGVRAFCIQQAEDGSARIRDATDLREGARLSCGLADSLQFTFTTGGAPAHLAILSVPEPADGPVLPYTASAGEAISLPAPAFSLDRPLPFSTRLAARHAAGTRVVVALFSERPLTAPEAEQAARAVASGGQPTPPCCLAVRSALLRVE